MSDFRMISTRIEKEYDPLLNEWESRIQFVVHDRALYSGFLADIPPLQLHTLICLCLFMKDSGKIEISVADLARALGISFDQAKKRIDSLLAFRYQDKPIVHVNKTRELNDPNERLSLSILPVSPITFVDERTEKQSPPIASDNADYLFEYLRLMLGVDRLPEQDRELLVALQHYPYELPPQVIEVLIEHVMEYKQTFDRQYLMTIAHSWSIAGIYTKEQALRWIRETKMLTSPAKSEDAPEAYLLQYLRERIRKQPSAVQINMVFQLLDEPFRFEPGCIEVLIDHVVAQISLTKGKPDFPKKYVEVIVQDWLERGVRTRQAAIQEVAEWNKRYLMKPPEAADKKDRVPFPAKSPAAARVKSEYLDKLRKAGLK
ncbi:DnaD domain protein [Effusibacillus pohliae]|uniref:DnaD domain protein n=1 Tax=Effusibacillus pohliae TaxID=232270 RepID=UPI000370B71C|nr:DnaD domain protein [Effusibacillus pohliae]